MHVEFPRDWFSVDPPLTMYACKNSVRNRNPKSPQVVQAQSLCVCVCVCVCVCACVRVCVCVCVQVCTFVHMYAL